MKCNIFAVVKLSKGTQIEALDHGIYYIHNDEYKSYAYLSYSAYKIVCEIDGIKSIKDITDSLTNNMSTQQDYENIIHYVFEDLATNGFIYGYNNNYYHSTIKYSHIFINKDIINKACIVLSLAYNIKIAFILCASILIIFIYVLFTGIFLPNNMTTNIFLLIISTFILLIAHELGHCAALKRYGIKSEGIGLGVYFYTPVLYADVSNAWKLNNRQRFIVDIGGFYFQSIVTVIYYIIGYFFNSYTLLCIVYFSVYLIIFNMNPFIKSDLYWGISDYFKLINLHKQSDEAVISYIRTFNKSKINIWLLTFGVCRCLFIILITLYVIYLFIKLINSLSTHSYDLTLWNIENGLMIIMAFGYLLYCLWKTIKNVFIHKKQ